MHNVGEELLSSPFSTIIPVRSIGSANLTTCDLDNFTIAKDQFGAVVSTLHVSGSVDYDPLDTR